MYLEYVKESVMSYLEILLRRCRVELHVVLWAFVAFFVVALVSECAMSDTVSDLVAEYETSMGRTECILMTQEAMKTYKSEIILVTHDHTIVSFTTDKGEMLFECHGDMAKMSYYNHR